jgi:5-methyltetrahydrofolate--homocysteine methyltransferase
MIPPPSDPGTRRGHRLALFPSLLAERILVLDGAMGTLIQALGLTEADFRGERLADHPHDLAGNNDLLCLTRPDVIGDIHRAYLDAGADIIETNSFNATAVSQAAYGTEGLVHEISLAAASVARKAADEAEAREPGRPRYVAGAMGPTARMASIPADFADPASRGVTFGDLGVTYGDAAQGLLEGGADLLLVETIYDTLNAKAAIYGIEEAFDALGVRVPIMLSATVGRGRRMLTGQTVEAFWNAVAHARPLSVGLNCGSGAADLRPPLEELSRIAPVFVSAYPNAGLPGADGTYSETPDFTAAALGEIARSGLVNIVGGCCGTTPDHVRAIVEAVRGVRPRGVPEIPAMERLSGLRPFNVEAARLRVVVREAEAAGSDPAALAALIAAGRFDDVIDLLRRQADEGAPVIVIDTGPAPVEAPAMTRLVNLMVTEPDLAALPFAIRSATAEAVEAALACLQGRAVVLTGGMAAVPAVRLERYGAALLGGVE